MTKMFNQITTTTHTNLGPLSSKIMVSQKFTASQDQLNAISLWIATYQKNIDLVATLKIWDAKKRRVLRTV